MTIYCHTRLILAARLEREWYVGNVVLTAASEACPTAKVQLKPPVYFKGASGQGSHTAKSKSKG